MLIANDRTSVDLNIYWTSLSFVFSYHAVSQGFFETPLGWSQHTYAHVQRLEKKLRLGIRRQA